MVYKTILIKLLNNFPKKNSISENPNITLEFIRDRLESNLDKDWHW